ncbi:hypothetical protein CDAR_113581 [Caerostris darwini]|uniref:Uncharacterized protein n=1 Tax=Caerostris darwini TaxID=1538125 RepID=A0AAV4NMC5_9ARAC|nr:hypothetical protein CDAR_113581 [Caerostris darwini]
MFFSFYQTIFKITSYLASGYKNKGVPPWGDFLSFLSRFFQTCPSGHQKCFWTAPFSKVRCVALRFCLKCGLGDKGGWVVIDDETGVWGKGKKSLATPPVSRFFQTSPRGHQKCFWTAPFSKVRCVALRFCLKWGSGDKGGWVVIDDKTGVWGEEKELSNPSCVQV